MGLQFVPGMAAVIGKLFFSIQWGYQGPSLGQKRYEIIWGVEGGMVPVDSWADITGF